MDSTISFFSLTKPTVGVLFKEKPLYYKGKEATYGSNKNWKVYCRV